MPLDPQRMFEQANAQLREGPSQGIAQGVQLGLGIIQAREKVEQMRQAAEIHKQNLDDGFWAKKNQLIQDLNNPKFAKTPQWKNYLIDKFNQLEQNHAKVMGRSPMLIDDDLKKVLTSTPEIATDLGEIISMGSKLPAGEREAYAYPKVLALFDGDATKAKAAMGAAFGSTTAQEVARTQFGRKQESEKTKYFRSTLADLRRSGALAGLKPDEMALLDEAKYEKNDPQTLALLDRLMSRQSEIAYDLKKSQMARNKAWQERNIISRARLAQGQRNQNLRAEDKIQNNDIIKAQQNNVTAADKALNILSAPNPTWINLREANVDLAQLMQVKPSAVVPIYREKGLNPSMFQQDVAKLKQYFSGEYEGNVPPELIGQLKDMLGRMRTVSTKYHAEKLGAVIRGIESAGIYSRGEAEDAFYSNVLDTNERYAGRKERAAEVTAPRAGKLTDVQRAQVAKARQKYKTAWKTELKRALEAAGQDAGWLEKVK